MRLAEKNLVQACGPNEAGAASLDSANKTKRACSARASIHEHAPGRYRVSRLSAKNCWP